MVVNTTSADFRGRFSDTSCAIIGAMKSLSPRNGFALFDEEDIGTLFDQYADYFIPDDRDRVIDEAKKLVSELRPVVQMDTDEHNRRVEAADLAGAKAGEIPAAATERHTKEMRQRPWRKLEYVSKWLTMNSTFQVPLFYRS